MYPTANSGIPAFRENAEPYNDTLPPRHQQGAGPDSRSVGVLQRAPK